MSDLGSAIRRTVQAAYDAWTAPAYGERTAGSAPASSPATVRPVRFVSWEELEGFAEAALDIDEQVKEEVARTLPGRPLRKGSRLRLPRRRRVA